MVEISTDDLARTDPGEFLNDSLIEMYMRCVACSGDGVGESGDWTMLVAVGTRRLLAGVCERVLLQYLFTVR